MPCLCRRYEALRPHLVRAGQLVPEEQAERRVLMLINPTMGEELPDVTSEM
jgi:gentisate 1,2-dioxygenase